MNIFYLRIKLKHNRYVSRMIVLACGLFLFYSAPVHAQGVADQVTKFGDQAKVVSDTTLHKSIKKGSIIPVPIIITEPALGGIGGGLALGYLHSNRNSLRKDTPPTISGVFGGYTANKSWLVGIAHSHSWDNDRIRYLGGIVKGNVNLAFYPNILPNESEPRALDVNLDAWATLQRVTFRMGKSDVWLGPQYIYFGTSNSLEIEDTDHPLLDSLINEISGKSSLGMLGLMVMWDTRKNTLSPDDGFYTGGKFDYNATYFGGTSNFFQSDIYFKYYFPIGKKVFGAVRMEYKASSGDVPFYAKPFISLRGVPAMRYQGNSLVVAETQWRWMFYKGISVLGFVGAGQAFEESKEILGQTIGNDEPLVINYGGGLRYTLKKAFGVRVGADVAWANDDFAWYISVGSSF